MDSSVDACGVVLTARDCGGRIDRGEIWGTPGQEGAGEPGTCYSEKWYKCDSTNKTSSTQGYQKLVLF